MTHPTAGRALRRGLHGAQHVSAAPRLGESDRDAALSGGDQRQKFVLLRLRAIDADRLSARERSQTPGPQQAAEGSRELPREQHLNDDVAALAAIFLIDPDAVKAGRRQLVPELERIVLFAPFQFPRPALGRFCIDPAADRIAEGQLFLGQ